MYSFEPSDEQKMLVDAIKRYSTSNLRPAAHDADEEGQYSPDLIEKGWELGFLQASIPETYGGFGERSAVTGVLAAEELSWGDLAGAMAVLTPGLFALPILLAGSEEQKLKFLPPIVEGEWKPNTAAFLEPHYDFDPYELKTVALENDGGYILNGEKTYVPYAKEADVMVVYARLGDKTQGFIVPNKAAGLTIGEHQKLLGIHALPVYPIKLENVQIPKEDCISGQEGQNFRYILSALRIAIAAMALGVSRAAYEYSRDYAKEREVFGVKVAQKQAIAFMLAEMATEIEAIRLLTWEAAWMMDQGKEEADKQAYLAQVGAADMAMMVTDRAVQILGGHGYIREHPVELWMRNGRGFATLTGLTMV
jgi:alkylation response protein AidB-like acyl-CoA dehydrogenase